MNCTIGRKISFANIEAAAVLAHSELYDLAVCHELYAESNVDSGAVGVCISAYRDTILALCRGDVTVEDARELWFAGEDPRVEHYDNKVITIREKRHAKSAIETEQSYLPSMLTETDIRDRLDRLAKEQRYLKAILRTIQRVEEKESLRMRVVREKPRK